MNLKKIIIIGIIAVFLLMLALLGLAWHRGLSESDGIFAYSQALELYKGEDYKKAYDRFAKVPNRAALKPAAIYRQAKCAEKMQSSQLANKLYKKLIRKYPNFSLSVKLKYLLAQNIYDESPKKSKKKFESIVKKYPNSEYAIASKYYLGVIQVQELSEITNPTKLELCTQKAEDYFRDYLKDAPAGRYAIYSINNLKDLKSNLSSEDNLIIARSYYALGEFELARMHLDRTNSADSWCDIVKNYYELNNYPKVKEFTEKGLSLYSQNVKKEDLYSAVDLYLQTQVGNKSQALANLSNLAKGKYGEDYIKYLTCQNAPYEFRDNCYSELYYNFQEGQFAADALSNVMFANIKAENYYQAKQLGLEHLKKYPKVKSTPFVLFWMAKTEERLKNYEGSREYYKAVTELYPDSYYAYRAYIDRYRIDNSLFADDIIDKPIVFPYEQSKDGNLVVKLALLKDYGLVNELCKNDKFVQSWLAYERGDYNTSVVLARDAMDKLETKPPKTDFRWRLVYPVHYYNDIKEFMLNNNPVLVLSVIKEESHFDTKATSAVSAKGLMQLMPQTAEEVRIGYGLNFEDANYLYNPRNNIQLGCMYLSKLKKINNGNNFLAILSYNGGAGMVKSWQNRLKYSDFDEFLEQVPYSETQNYLKKVYKAYWNYARIYGE